MQILYRWSLFNPLIVLCSKHNKMNSNRGQIQRKQYIFEQNFLPSPSARVRSKSGLEMQVPRWILNFFVCYPPWFSIFLGKSCGASKKRTRSEATSLFFAELHEERSDEFYFMLFRSFFAVWLFFAELHEERSDEFYFILFRSFFAVWLFFGQIHEERSDEFYFILFRSFFAVSLVVFC